MLILDDETVRQLDAEADKKAKFLDVQAGPELHRIRTLPRRDIPDPTSPDAVTLASFLTSRLAKSATPYPGPLKPVQALALREAWERKGLFAPIRVGGGKTLLSYLLPAVLGAKRPVYICPATLKTPILTEFSRYARDWRGPLPAAYPIVSIELISNPSGAEDRDEQGNVIRLALLERLQPDLIVIDEAHRCAAAGAACTKRIRAYKHKYPSTIVVAMTGTPFKTSIKDCAHVMEWCLGRGAPLPTDFLEREAWASYLDAKTGLGPRAGAGALVEMLTSDEEQAFDAESEEGARKVVRRAIARRILETPGVIGTQDPPLSVGLSVSAYYPRRQDPALDRAFDELRETWFLPDGTELADGREFARHAATLGRGHWNKWEPAPPAEWREARNEWARFVRKTIKTNRIGLDTEARVARAVQKGLVEDDGLLQMWLDVRDAERTRTGLREPPSIPVWVSGECVEAVRAWLVDHPGVVWVDSIGLGARLEAELGIPYYRNKGMSLSGKSILQHPPGTPAVASLASNGTGKNLQKIWSKNLWLCAPGEQSLGRTHREGQTASQVENWVYLGCAEHLAAFERAKDVKADFAGDLLLSPQRLTYAATDLPTPRELAMRLGVRWQKTT